MEITKDGASPLSLDTPAKEEASVQRLTILHAGDVFLDGPVGRLRRDTREHRREELRESFEAFMKRVAEEGADAVVFSGNLLYIAQTSV